MNDSNLVLTRLSLETFPREACLAGWNIHAFLNNKKISDEARAKMARLALLIESEFRLATLEWFKESSLSRALIRKPIWGDATDYETTREKLLALVDRLKAPEKAKRDELEETKKSLAALCKFSAPFAEEALAKAA